MKFKLGELKLNDVITFLKMNNLKLVVVENKNDLMVNEINPNFELEAKDNSVESEVKNDER